MRLRYRCLWLLVGFSWGGFSCLSPHGIRMADTNPEAWTPSQAVTVSYENTDTVSVRDLYAVVRFCHNFDYDKLALTITTVTPDGYRWRDTLSMNVYGRLPQIGMYGELEQAYRRNVVLQQPGRYLFILAPAMPDTLTRGVAAVGIRLDAAGAGIDTDAADVSSDESTRSPHAADSSRLTP